MTFRNDHEASLARVSTLEAEVEALQAQLAETHAEVRRLEGVLELRDTTAHDDPQPASANARAKEDDPAGIVMTIAVLLVFAPLVLAGLMA